MAKGYQGNKTVLMRSALEGTVAEVVERLENKLGT
jgi:hypothetical protein